MLVIEKPSKYFPPSDAFFLSDVFNPAISLYFPDSPAVLLVICRMSAVFELLSIVAENVIEFKL